MIWDPDQIPVGGIEQVRPLLEVFHADHSGPTRSFMPLRGNPAIDYGLGCPDVDQRGMPRPIGAACDVGSVEYGWLVFLPAILR